MSVTLRPISVLTAPGEDGFLVLDDGYLVAVLVRLSADYGEDAGRWFYEAGFGPLDGPAHPIFAELDDATTYVERRLAAHNAFRTGSRDSPAAEPGPTAAS